jgi:hypothetical protein
MSSFHLAASMGLEPILVWNYKVSSNHLLVRDKHMDHEAFSFSTENYVLYRS